MLFLFGAAYAKRLLNEDALAAGIVAQLGPGAEDGSDVADPMPGSGPGSGTGTMPALEAYLWWWQGPAVYLIEQHRHYPQLERTMLLTEARRSYDGIYLYPFCYNWDLRQQLIAHCARHFPDDPAVAWAAARTLTTCGDFENAVKWFEKARELKLDPADVGDSERDVAGRCATALVLLGREQEAEQLYAADAAVDKRDADRRWAWLDFLCKEGRYDDVLRLARLAEGDFPGDRRFPNLVKRALFWQGDLAGFCQAVVPGNDWAATGASLMSAYLQRRNSLLAGLQAYTEPDAGFNSSWVETENLRYFALYLTYKGIPFARFEKPEWQMGGVALFDEAIQKIEGDDAMYLYGNELVDLINRQDFARRMANLADLYGAVQKPQYLAALLAEDSAVKAQVRDAKAAARDSYSEQLDNLQSLASTVEGQILRAYILAHEWDKADTFEEQLGKPAWGEDSPSRQSARLLVAIAKGKPIVKDEMDLGELASTGGLVNVLLSEHFRAALKSGGKPGDEVLAQIRTAVTPNRDTYYDFSNGDLNWNW